MINWYNIFTIIIVLILLTFLFIIYRIINNTVPKTNITYDNIRNKLKTGDLFLVSYDSIYGYLVRIFKGCCWTHASLVYKTKNQLYIIEIARYDDDKTYKGLLMLPIDKWLKFNRNKALGYCEYKGYIPSDTKIEKKFREFEHVKVNLNTIYWMNTLIKWNYYPENRKKYFCTEFLAKFLQDLGMISKKYLPCSYSPETLSELKQYGNIKIFLNK